MDDDGGDGYDRGGFSSNRPVPGPGPVGFGDREIPRNRVTALYMVDRPALDEQKGDAQTQTSLVPMTSLRQLGIEPDEALVRDVSHREGDSITAGDLYASVRTSFNGAGKKAKQKYPNDPKKQIAYMMSLVEWAGLAVEAKEYFDVRGDRRDKQDLAGVIFGTYTILAPENIYPGDEIEWRLPAPRDTMGSPVRSGTEPGKVVLEPRVRSPETLWETVLREVSDRARTGAPAAMRDRDANLVLEDAWQYYYNTMRESHDLYVLLRLKQLVDVGAIAIGPGPAAEFGLFTPAAVAGGVAGFDVVMALSRVMGMIPGTDSSPLEDITPAKLKNYMALNHDIMNKFFYDGKIENHAFHFDPNNPNNPWPSAHVPSRDPAQRLTQRQLNCAKKESSAADDAVRSSRRFVKARCYAGSAAGGPADVVLYP